MNSKNELLSHTRHRAWRWAFQQQMKWLRNISVICIYYSFAWFQWIVLNFERSYVTPSEQKESTYPVLSDYFIFTECLHFTSYKDIPFSHTIRPNLCHWALARFLFRFMIESSNTHTVQGAAIALSSWLQMAPAAYRYLINDVCVCVGERLNSESSQNASNYQN